MHAACQTHDGWEHGKQQPAAAVVSHHHLMGDIVPLSFQGDNY
jgi:hypothetical protein